MGMPKDRQGGKGKTLAGLMLLFLFLPGLSGVNPILLPLFSAGIGTALNKPRLRKYGFGLYIWYAVGFVVTPLLTFGGWYGTGMTTRDPVLATMVAMVIMLILGLLVFFSIWGTYAGLRRGIQASIRDRGIIGGEDPRPVKKKGRRDDDDDDDDRPRKRNRDRDREDRDEDEDDRPRKKETSRDSDRDREDDRDEPPVPARRAARVDDRPKKRMRDDDDSDHDRPKNRRDDDDSDHDRPRRQR